MPTRETPWPAGTPNWVDCSFDHMHKAKHFYSRLFAWEILEGGEQMGGYDVAVKHRKAVAGLAPRTMAEVPSEWSTTFATDDVDATTRAVTAAGGTVLVEAMDVPNTGRIAFYRDPEGAVFGAWQAGEHIGFGLFNEPGSVGWNDLMTRDLAAAQTFYSAVFGFSYEPSGDGYVLVERPGDGAVVAGMHHATELPDDASTGWLTHFVVADRDTAIATVEELDGEVLASFDTPFGPEATVRGLEGEVFNVIAFSPQAEEQAEHAPDAQGD